jgi:hypothetical protein
MDMVNSTIQLVIGTTIHTLKPSRWNLRQAIVTLTKQWLLPCILIHQYIQQLQLTRTPVITLPAITAFPAHSIALLIIHIKLLTYQHQIQLIQ